MAQITRKRVGELMRKLFEILMASPTGVQASDALQRLEKAVTLTTYEEGSYESGGRRFEKIVRFATVDCVKAGWLTKAKGVWSVTEAGVTAYNQYPDAETFYKRACQLYAEWRASQPEAASHGVEDAEAEGGEEKAVAITFEEAEEQAWSEIEQYLKAMNPYDFQDLVADLLRAMKYHVDWVAPPGKDGGIDILAWPDPLGTRAPRMKVQVKRQIQAVSAEGLRSFMALLDEDDVGIFVSLGGFTKDAQESARTQSRRKVTLIGLDRLFDLWVDNYSSLSEGARQRLPLKPIYFLAPRT